MLKKIMEMTVVALLVAGVVGVYFKVVGALPIAVTQTQKMTTFDVSGEGKIVVVPDEATLQLGVTDQGRNLKTVQQAINIKMEQVSKSLEGMGIDKADIKTTGYNVYSDYQEEGLYRAQANLSVKIRDLDKVSEALDLVGTLGLDSVSGPVFGLSDELSEKSMREAREMAIEKAKNKAYELADLSGMKLGRIVNISESGTGGYPVPMYAREMAVSSTMEAKVATPVEAGSSEVVVNVTLSYETR
ncbi:MAG: SIMPL domain-containing protein [Candidatus Microgenomates bacterium]